MLLTTWSRIVNKEITIQDIRDLDPCYDPGRYLPDNWSGTVMDILEIDSCPVEDRFWVVLREEFLPENLLHEFACLCAESVLHSYEDSTRKMIDLEKPLRPRELL